MLYQMNIRMRWRRIALVLVYVAMFGAFVIVSDSQIEKSYYDVANGQPNSSNASAAERHQGAPASLTTMSTAERHQGAPASLTTVSAARSGASRCPVRFPSFVDVRMNNFMWQRVHEMDIFLYAAYYDGRQVATRGQRFVRVLGMKDICALPPMYCQLWYEGERAPHVVKASQQWLWFNCKEAIVPNEYHAIMYTCRLPRRRGAVLPRFVSVAPLPCTPATNALAVSGREPPPGGAAARQDFGVCVKGLNFLDADISERLVEWIEMHRLLGAQKIFFYKYDVTPAMDAVLRHYERVGVVDVTPLTLPGAHPNEPRMRSMFVSNNSWQAWLMEVFVYTDCLYRNINTYRYLAVVDIDEIIVPRRGMTWQTIMAAIRESEPNIDRYASYTFRNEYFLDQFFVAPSDRFPPFMHALQHVNRSAKLSPKGEDIKSFVNTQGALSVHNHWPLQLLPGYEPVTYWVDESVARMQHYRSTCSTVNETACDPSYTGDVVTDTTIWKYAEPLVQNALRATEAVNNILATE